MILIDSCIYIEHLRAGRDPAQVFAPYAQRHDLATCGVIRCEVIRGMRTPKARRALADYMDCLLYIPTLNNVWEAAEEVLWQTDRAGFKIPVTDAIIAVCAMKAGGAVLTKDKHFKAIPGLRVFEEFPG
ncbi:MAG: putative nucleic acid-binding protein contains PIN domain [Limisphaerales bacterium]|nr:MAG: putative nucleic acid-binding protein contains PIN domain [Limisphaerales bacterium]KAG0508551.1 MAG: putative nucleic acid-binding protein contains PIN domain [Limisphaerales bacterium]TXT50137.1 MAG: putative nucleic acid-binding protein contains PIN domain [Limisphaerales bacterium]